MKKKFLGRAATLRAEAVFLRERVKKLPLFTGQGRVGR